METKTAMFPQLTLITPSMAENWLKYNNGNRSVKKPHLQKYCDEILSGDFLLTHHAIAFSGTPQAPERLLDGQHRLHAVVVTGRAINQWVFWCVPNHVFAVLDGGVSRTFQDHHGWGKNEIAITSFIFQMALGHGRKLTKAYADKIMVHFGDLIQSVMKETTQHGKGFSTSARVALIYTIMRFPGERENLLSMWRKMISGDLNSLPNSWVRCFVKLTTGDLPKASKSNGEKALCDKRVASFALAAKCMEPTSWPLTKIYVDPEHVYSNAGKWMKAAAEL